MNNYLLKQIMEDLKNHKNISNPEMDIIYDSMKKFFIDIFADGKFFFRYPVNLLDDLTGYHCIFYNDKILSKETAEENLEAALDTLTDMEKEIMKLFYQQYWNTDELAKRYCIDSDKIRDIISISLQKLREPRRMKIIYSSYSLVSRAEEAKKALEIEIYKYTKKRLELLDNIPPELSDIIDNINLHDLGLTTRTYNKLIKSGITSVKQLTNLTLDDYKRLKFGTTSIIEIKDKLAKIYLTCNR